MIVAPSDRFLSDARYLLAAGWVRDGQDLGLWLDPAPRGYEQWIEFGTAFQIQLERDGVSMLSATTEEE